MLRTTLPASLRTLIRGDLASLATLALTGATFAQDLTPKLGPTKSYAVVNATLHPVSSGPIEKGTILFDAGLITYVGPAIAIPDGAEVIAGEGLHVYPGLIGSYTQMGLTEMGLVRATRDFAEVGGITPEVRACVAFNPDSTLLPVARSNGVLITATFPSGGTIAGRASVMRMDGWTWEQMAITQDAGLVVNWPVPRPVTAWWMDKSESEQQRDIDAQVRQIDDALAGAKAYVSAKAADAAIPTDIRFEAMRSVLEKKTPVLVLANDHDQIVQAVQMIVIKHGLKLSIVGGRDAPMSADMLKRHSVGVIVDGTIRFPKRDDAPYDDAYTVPARLQEAGVQWCLASGDETPHERNLPYSAAIAVSHGLPHEAGVRGITLGAAEVLGIADRYGSLEKGKSATLIITTGDVLEVATQVKMAFIDGRASSLRDKQKLLEEQYRSKYGK